MLVNEAGDFHFLGTDLFESLINYELNPTSIEFLNLKGKHFITDTSLSPVINLLATKLRSKQAYLKNFTALHMVVVTLRCNHRCDYCHASSQAPAHKKWDMDSKTALNVVRTIMETPSPVVKIEFQGGEPLLNFEVVRFIVKEAKKLNRKKRKNLSFVICTNLTLLDEHVLFFLKKEGISISTSLDGPKLIHNHHRIMRSGESSYDYFLKKLSLARTVLGGENISALMTTTKTNLSNLKSVIDEYVRLNFKSIFIRPLNPYGNAVLDSQKQSLDYPIEEFVEAYKKALLYIIKLNLQGIYLEEVYATILLSRILTPFSTGFVDLQSPTGAGISGVIYDYNGDVYPADEARMLAKMGDRKFFMGNVNHDPYLKIFESDILRKLVKVSCVQTLPGCHSCAFQIFCGSDPIRNYATQGSLEGHQPTSGFCVKNRGIIQFLLELIYEGNPDIMDVFWSWITKRSLSEVRGENKCAN